MKLGVMHKYQIFIALFAVLLVLSCTKQKKPHRQISVTNTLGRDRSYETVSIDLEKLSQTEHSGGVIIVDAETASEIISQQIDTDGDGTMDLILFQPEITANSERIFEVRYSEATKKENDSIICYSRFVPERTDDYAWENDRVAFRTYGPTAQQMVEERVAGGTLSSGIDAWLKRVEYPIINKWYEKELKTDGSYHEDTGEGLDNFHVGISRGVGGIGKKLDSTYYFSKNFTSWKTMTTGPIRTSFILSYADWNVAGKKISEVKEISLDRGNNLSRFEIRLQGTDSISAGLTLHDKQGVVEIDKANEWISYWEPHFDSELGTGIVAAPSTMISHEHYSTDRKDESNLYMNMRSQGGKVVYYAGFGWKKSGNFTSKEQWDSYLKRFSEQLRNPLVVRMK